MKNHQLIRRGVQFAALFWIGLAVFPDGAGRIFAQDSNAENRATDEGATAAPSREQLEKLVGEIREIAKLASAMSPDALGKVRDHEAMLALATLHAEKAQILYYYAERDAYYMKDFKAELASARGIFEALKAGRNPEVPTRGRIERAYIAACDNSVQPYWLFVPPNYNPAHPAGLLVFLHGYHPGLNKVNWFETMFCPELETIAERLNYVVLLPYARSNTDFQGIGEDDVMETVSLAQREFAIDPDRVVLTGGSMGGMGVLTIAAHYPDAFAGIVPISARGDFYLWKGMEELSLPAWKRIQMDMEFGKPLAQNLQMQSFFFHGARDYVVQPAQSRNMSALLKAMGYPVRYLELAASDHWCWSDVFAHADLGKWLADVRRERCPKRIAYKTWHLKFNRAYWLSIQGMASFARPAVVEAEWAEETAGKRIPLIAIKSENVTRLDAALPEELCGAARKVVVSWNGEITTHDVTEKRFISLASKDAGPEDGLRKTPRQCGRIREAYAQPFVIVYSTRDESSKAAAAQAAKDWMLFTQGSPSFMPDRDITREMIRDYNLIIYGLPAEKTLLAEIPSKLPIRVEGDNYVVGERRIPRGNLGMSVIYPNPLEPKRSVVLNVGPVWGRELPKNHKYDFLPDFIIFSDEKAEDGTESNKAVCAGYFDGQWRLSADSEWFADPAR
ncbi:MAG TPA: prolyl oligopeptidase family serine peptidase [Candidatus Brocadiia bacterium]|nr:prolyl oligopeptidase family serine peptidase [Candidatus Brocadiia bacterium]